MPLQKPERYGAADAGSSVRMSTLKHHHRAKGATGSISGGASQKQQRAKGTAAGKGALVDEEMTPQKLRRGGNQAVGGVHRRTASRLPSQMPCTSIRHGEAEGKKNTKSKTSTLSRNIKKVTHAGNSTYIDNAYSLDGKRTVDDDCKESAAYKNIQEAYDVIQRLNELGLGEDMSSEEFFKYFDQLPTSPSFDSYTKLDEELLTPLYERHARHCLRYLKLLQESKDKLNAELEQHNAMDLLEEEDSGKLLARMRYFEDFEKDGTLDWIFHPDLCRLESLDDYQCLVPQNHGCSEYVKWDMYYKFAHSYETEQEYLYYCEELSKKLKWLEDYVLLDERSRKWGMISTRGVSQAFKIATGFSKITVDLAYTGYYECVDNMRYDAFWLKDLDGVYFEIWLRVTEQKKSFREALEEVYKLKRFPSRQDRMKYALENDCSDMEMEFSTYTSSVTSEVTKEKANDVITEAVTKMERPKLYEHYIRKKIAIAKAIDLVRMVEQSTVRAASRCLKQ